MPIKIDDLELYDVPELAELLRIKEKTVRKLISTGQLKGRKLAKKYYVTNETLKAYFRHNE